MTDGIQLQGALTVRHFRDHQCIAMEAGRQTVTTVGKRWLVDLLQNLPALTEQVKFHQSGTNGTVATTADVSLGTAVGSPVAGTQTETGPTIYRSVATVTYTGAYTIAEWGIFTTSVSGVLFARKTLAAARSVLPGDRLQFTWDLTVS